MIATAELAGTMAAKRTADLIPLCHPLPLTKAAVTIEPDEALPGFRVSAEVRTVGATGVEMEALTAVSVACLTLFDMLKAIDRTMEIGGIRVTSKQGGRSGDWSAAMISFDEAVRLVTEVARPLGRETRAARRGRRPGARGAGRRDDRFAARGLLGDGRLCGPRGRSAGHAAADRRVLPGRRLRRRAGAGDLRPDLHRRPGARRARTGSSSRKWRSGTAIRRRSPSLPVPRGTSGRAARISAPATCFSRRGGGWIRGRWSRPRARTWREVETWRRAGACWCSAPATSLRRPGEARRPPGAIPESVSFGVAALAEQWGGRSLGSRRLADDLPALERAAGEALEQADLVVVTGGASVGEKDFAKAMFAPHGLDLIFSKVAIKPGKPVWLGRAGASAGPRPARQSDLGDGHRAAAARAARRRPRRPRPERSNGAGFALGAPLPACGDRETFHRARLTGEGAVPLANQDSGAQKALAEADLLLRSRPDDPPRAGRRSSADRGRARLASLAGNAHAKMSFAPAMSRTSPRPWSSRGLGSRPAPSQVPSQGARPPPPRSGSAARRAASAPTANCRRGRPAS